MGKSFILKVFCAVFIVIAVSGSAYPKQKNIVKIINVSDGDTVTAAVSGNKRIKIRLYGIDAPEISQEYGEASKNHLKSLLKNKILSYEEINIDSYGRTVATIFADGENINLKMIKDGFAWHYASFYKSAEYAAAQKKAKDGKLGLWKRPSPVPPWEFRREAKQNPVSQPEPYVTVPFDFYICINVYDFDIIARSVKCPRNYISLVGKK